MSRKIVKDTLKFAVKANASDVHFSSGMPPLLRIAGQMKKVDMPPLDNETLTEQLLEFLDTEQRQVLTADHELDFALQLSDTARFRVNIYMQMRGISAAFRVINQTIRTIEELRMPAVFREMIKRKKGLILLTGPTGSGKTTTLAALINEINQNRREHIITIEDPIEYVHPPANSLVHQREIGPHTHSFANALRASLREDPDVILVGEMRDLETITYALQAAETGHLVLSTLHTNSAAETIDRIINVFPPEQQQQTRIILANTLISAVAQRLVPAAMKNERVAIMEILIGTSATRNLIREGKTYQIDSAIQTGTEFGMQNFEKSFNMLRQNNMIAPDLELHDVF